ncbi:pyruvate formate lyase family protein [Enterococcus termitis]
MDIKEFSAKLAEATKELSPEEQTALMKMFATVSDDLNTTNSTSGGFATDGQTSVPSGITPRLEALKENYLKQVPTITTHRARVITEIAKENPGMPKNVLRAKSFKRCCETAPLVIQDNELIVGAPNGAPRAGSFSPDIAWRWMEEEIDTISDRPQDPFFISDEDKKIMREELFPFWKGKSIDEYCEDQFREAGFGNYQVNPLFPIVRIIN